MTSDEEVEDVGGHISYIGYRKAYLSPQLFWLNAHLDDLHHRDFAPRPYVRKTWYWTFLPPTEWIRKLPLNVYNGDYLLAAGDEGRRQLQVGMNTHSFVYHR